MKPGVINISFPDEDKRKFSTGLHGTFDFIGGPLDGDTQDVPLDWCKVIIGGHDYRLAVIECEGETPPIKYCLVHKSLIPKEKR